MRIVKSTRNIVFWIVLLLVVAATLYPFLVMISGSLKTDFEMNNYPLRLIVRDPVVIHYEALFTVIPFLRQFFNSMFVAFASASLAIFISALVAFGFSRYEFRAKKLLFLLILGTMLIPGPVLLVPQFQMYLAMGLFGTYVPLILPAGINAFGIFLIRQVMSQIPYELYESAMMDGCSDVRSFFTIAIPLSKAGLGIVGILAFMGSWNDFFTPLLYLQGEETFTLPLGLVRLQNFYAISYGASLAGAFVSCIPIILLLTIVGQKYFVSGFMAGAIKG